MKKLLLPFILLFVLIVSACSNDNSADKEKDKKKEEEPKTFTYQSQTGPVEVPTHPKRVVMLSGFTGNVINLGVNLVGVETWSKTNPTFEKELKDVEVVSEDNVEKIIELDPDLIIALSTVKNLDKIKKIAPTVTYEWGKLNYLDQHVEIGKLLNKEKEAQAWVDDFQKRATEAGDKIRAKIGEDATVSVIEAYDKDLYVYGDHWARGTEILYQTMKLKMPKKVEEATKEPGYFTLSQEVIPEYAGDYVILSKYTDADTSFQETETFKNMPAVKNNHVYEMEGNGASFTDPVTLEKQLKFFTKSFLGE